MTVILLSLLQLNFCNWRQPAVLRFTLPSVNRVWIFRPRRPKTQAPHHTEKETKNYCRHWPQTRHFQQFQIILTLFSEFFSSFPRGTCELSVSRCIFSFRWNLPPNSLGLHYQATRLDKPYLFVFPKSRIPKRGFHPLCRPFPGIFWVSWLVNVNGKTWKTTIRYKEFPGTFLIRKRNPEPCTD